MTRESNQAWEGRRIGILGGTFDPPHVGHTRMAAIARDVLDLDRVLLSPAPHPPHKSDADTTPYAHRVAMVEAAVAGEEHILVATIEDAHSVSYTVELLHACRRRTDADLYFILGADSLAELWSWRDPVEIMRLATLVVFPRATAHATGGVEQAPGAPQASLVIFESPVIDVSSTAIRARLECGESAGAGLAGPVAAYIAHHGLYARA